ncbi:photosynthetic NDH subunit of subcomplex B 5, chloroplastic [Vitis riparia]|uniref:photosynthetic NDH subunit of subcomplex B 5, chloroplastic n=1 Tax=Vitis riparia TaxID=96939 RepID=UPI00155ABECC|nr:photosynthetic NDH subunit of subcomplex B 5, chloroplastic [Vitis riparia]
MAVSSSPSVLSTTLLSRISPSSQPLEARVRARFSIQTTPASTQQLKLFGNLRRLNAAGLSEIEPDLNEDPVDRWGTNGISSEDFKYGYYDGHHTYFEGDDKGTFWGAIAEDYAAVEPPTGFQGFISWAFLPAIAAGMYFNVPGEYLYIGAALFAAVFCIIEMDKPDKPHNFEPQIYNMERGARDKLIADYNTMDIWEFNEKYGDLWDFTVKKDDIEKR